MKTGYCITTRRFTLRCKHPEWLETTQEYYNRIVLFYYQLLHEHIELHSLNNQQIMRSLEVLSIPGRDKAPVPTPLPWGKVPLYFRRAAINAAIAMVKSYLNKGGYTNQASHIRASVVYYKGMYRDFVDDSIALKVFDGSRWQWMHCRLSGNTPIGNAQIMSPTVVLKENNISLNVPVKEEVEDARTSKERMAAGDNLCSLIFTNSDAFAVACVLNQENEQTSARFFGGGKEYAHHCNEILKKIQKSELSRGKEGQSQTAVPAGEKINQKYWMHLKNLSEHYAHQVSSQIIAYCLEHQVSTIILPAVSEKSTKPVMKAAGNWSPLHLSMRIRNFLSYKAWKAGIVVLEVAPTQTMSVCSVCGAPIRSRRELCECTNGHTTNRYLNSARNLGRMCREDFARKSAQHN